MPPSCSSREFFDLGRLGRNDVLGDRHDALVCEAILCCLGESDDALVARDHHVDIVLIDLGIHASRRRAHIHPGHPMSRADRCAAIGEAGVVVSQRYGVAGVASCAAAPGVVNTSGADSLTGTMAAMATVLAIGMRHTSVWLIAK